MSHARSRAGRHTELGTSLSESEGATRPREGHGQGASMEAKVMECLLCVGNGRQTSRPKGALRLKWSAVKWEEPVRCKV